nr:hypothetical protein [Nocardia alni]
MPIVLFVAERGQNLTAPMLNTLRHVLHNREEMRPELRVQLEQRPDMTLGDNDHMIGSEAGNRRSESKHTLRLGHNVDLDHPGNDLIAIPIRLCRNRQRYGQLDHAPLDEYSGD